MMATASECTPPEHDGIMTLAPESDDFKPSPMRFVVAALLCLSSALSGYILFTYVTIW